MAQEALPRSWLLASRKAQLEASDLSSARLPR